VLDVLITVSESTPRNFVTECRRSVRVAADLAQYPVNVIEVPGVPGHIGQAMLGGLAKSTAEYVAWVDDDDFVLPNAFTCLERHFAAKPAAVCAREIRLLANGRLVPMHHRHHLVAFRRDVVDSVPLREFKAFTNLALYRAAGTSVIDELSWVYIYRLRRSGGMALRRVSPAERLCLQ
jgi:hypothetical protein